MCNHFSPASTILQASFQYQQSVFPVEAILVQCIENSVASPIIKLVATRLLFASFPPPVLKYLCWVQRPFLWLRSCYSVLYEKKWSLTYPVTDGKVMYKQEYYCNFFFYCKLFKGWQNGQIDWRLGLGKQSTGWNPSVVINQYTPLHLFFQVQSHIPLWQHLARKGDQHRKGLPGSKSIYFS